MFFQRLLRYILAPVGKLIEWTDLWLIKKSCLGHVDGVAICDNSIIQKSSKEFFKMTCETMALIKKTDFRRYRRVCRQIAYIVNKEMVEAGNFEEKLKICNVDYTKFFALPDPEWRVRSYACLLIHESTHGMLIEKGIRYNKDTRLRIERLCRREEFRFAQNFEQGFAETFIGPFDPALWEIAWGPHEQRISARWKRFRESLREAFFKR